MMAIDREIARELGRRREAERSAEPTPGPVSRNPYFGTPVDVWCLCGALVHRADSPHPDRDIEVIPAACEQCRRDCYCYELAVEIRDTIASALDAAGSAWSSPGCPCGSCPPETGYPRETPFHVPVRGAQ